MMTSKENVAPKISQSCFVEEKSSDEQHVALFRNIFPNGVKKIKKNLSNLEKLGKMLFNIKMSNVSLIYTYSYFLWFSNQLVLIILLVFFSVI